MAKRIRHVVVLVELLRMGRMMGRMMMMMRKMMMMMMMGMRKRKMMMGMRKRKMMMGVIVVHSTGFRVHFPVETTSVEIIITFFLFLLFIIITIIIVFIIIIIIIIIIVVVVVVVGIQWTIVQHVGWYLDEASYIAGRSSSC